jgi:hypothetical protein
MPMSASAQQTTPLGNFNYGSLQSLMVFFSVPASVVKPLLKGTGLEPGIFDGKALVNMNFERYAGFGSNYSSYVDEVEFNVVAFPRFRAGTEPALTVQQYISGDDQSKTYGNFRVNVPCDNGPAVTAGSTQYGEIKFVASFDFAVPGVNSPSVTTWWVRCFTTPTAPKSQLPYIFDLKVNTNVAGAPASGIAAFSPVPAYANLKVKGKKHMVTSARVVFGVFKSWLPTPGKTPITPLPAGMVQLTVGDAKHLMTRQMAKVFAGNPAAVGVLLYESQPAAASGHTLLNTVLR